MYFRLVPVDQTVPEVTGIYRARYWKGDYCWKEIFYYTRMNISEENTLINCDAKHSKIVTWCN